MLWRYSPCRNVEHQHGHRHRQPNFAAASRLKLLQNAMNSRRSFLECIGLAAVQCARGEEPTESSSPLQEFGYRDVELTPCPAQVQFEETIAVLLSLNEDSLLKPWRLRSGLAAPGPELGGWYDEVPLQKTESGGHGFAPGHCFGQWISALSRAYAINRSPEIRTRLNATARPL